MRWWGGDMPRRDIKVRQLNLTLKFSTSGTVNGLWIPSKLSRTIPPLRRLSAIEFRHSLRSMLGFDLKVAIREAEQTTAETSLVMALAYGSTWCIQDFTNDTNGNPLDLQLPGSVSHSLPKQDCQSCFHRYATTNLRSTLVSCPIRACLMSNERSKWYSPLFLRLGAGLYLLIN